ncbi:envelope glycoprotein [Simian immunodeficiency virus]|uniref:Envelope glycoprotein gp160 n=2 Tax=Simian immunodeficiency virus TaxID=11723 RepID=J7FDM5_SIV|nr:envelope glycoprotein [Simian immunodeficiency virus]
MKMALLIGWILTIIFCCKLGIGTYYTTVYYGVPVWKEATPTLFCASSAKVASTQPHNIWATHNCVPLDPQPYEIPINITTEFNMETNYMVEEMKKDLISLFQQSLKPCVKLTPFCVKMNCSEFTRNSTTGNNATKNNTSLEDKIKSNLTSLEMYECFFNQTTEFRDKKKQIYSLFYKEDIMKDKNDSTNTSYYLINCNTTAITQECEKSSFEPVPIQYCAPPGYAMLKCKDENFRGKGNCTTVRIVHCTHSIFPMIATALHLNGSVEEGETKAYYVEAKHNAPLLIKFNKATVFNITCVRPGNNTRGQVQIGPGMTFYNIRNVIGDTRKAFCYVNKTLWENATEAAKVAINETLKNTTFKNTTYTFRTDGDLKWISGGDQETQTHWFNCQGEFFYCDLKNWTNNGIEIDGMLIAPCRLRQIVNHWGIVSRGIYLPPREGQVKCVSSITGFIMTAETNDTDGTITPTFSAKVEDYWKVEMSRYKVVEIQPLSVAPTKGKRPVVGDPEAKSRSKREIGMGMIFMGFLSAAGSTMGAASIALTVQARGLLSGIVQQQANLLQAIEAQQHLLQLSVWGIKQLQARLLAVEKYLRDQQLLGLWGCANKLICHSSLEWNSSWLNKTLCGNKTNNYENNYECIWSQYTWQQWDEEIRNISDVIYLSLETAQVQQERNHKQLLELDKWSSLWNWFDITNWLWYIKIAIIIVASLVGLRIVMFIINLVGKLRQGYSLLSPQIPIQTARGPGQPEGTEEGGGESGRDRWRGYPVGFLQLIWEDCRQLLLWIYQTSVNLLWHLWTLIKLIHQWSLLLWETVRQLLRRLIHLLTQFLHLLETWGILIRQHCIVCIDTLAEFTGWWTDGVIEALRVAVDIIRHIPTRIRQGLEIALN